jgi:hypothetical protein
MAEFAYNVRYVALHGRRDLSNPWSLRHAAIYERINLHDFTSQRILLQMPKSVKSKLSHAATEHRVPQAGQRSTIDLECHILVFFFTVKDWRWYLSFLETKLQELVSLLLLTHT